MTEDIFDPTFTRVFQHDKLNRKFARTLLSKVFLLICRIYVLGCKVALERFWIFIELLHSYTVRIYFICHVSKVWRKTACAIIFNCFLKTALRYFNIFWFKMKAMGNRIISCFLDFQLKTFL